MVGTMLFKASPTNRADAFTDVIDGEGGGLENGKEKH
jgi:hypothetical protein